jgi:hypothetical protein
LSDLFKFDCQIYLNLVMLMLDSEGEIEIALVLQI